MNKLAKITGVTMLSIGLLAGCGTNKAEEAKADEPKKEVVELTEEEKYEKKLVGEWISMEIESIYDFREDGQVTMESSFKSKELFDYKISEIRDGFAVVELTQGYNIKNIYVKIDGDLMIKSPVPNSSTEIEFYRV